MKKYLSLVLALVMLVTLLAGCGGSGSSGSDTPSRTDVNVSINKAFTSLDPHGTPLLQDNIVLWQVFSALLHFNELTGAAEPDLAESYDVSEDGTVYTFKLRDDIYFHNGDPVTADDVVFSLTRCMDPNMGRSIYTASIKEVKAVDEKTVDVVLKAPSAPFLVNMCYVFIISQKEVEEQGAEFGTKPCSGTGPYMVTELDPDQKIVLTAFDQYYKGKASIETVNFYIVTDSAAGQVSFEAGDLDWYSCSAADYARLSQDPTYGTEAMPANHITYMAVNPTANDALANEKVRQAIAYAIDKEELNDAAFDGLGEAADFFYNPKWNVGAPGDGFHYTYDPEKAKSLLAEAGYPNGVNVGKLLCWTGGHFEVCATTIQAQLAKVGIQCELEWNEQGVALNRGTAMDFDMIVSGFACGGDYDEIRKRVYSSSTAAYIKYQQTDYDWQWMDETLDTASATTDPVERIKLNQEHSDYVLNTATQIPLVHKCVFFTWNADLNVKNRPINPIIYDWSWN